MSQIDDSIEELEKNNIKIFKHHHSELQQCNKVKSEQIKNTPMTPGE